MDKIAVLVPCYNEGKTIEKVVTDFKRVLPEAVIYVYDNNSTDGTAEIAAKAGAVVRQAMEQVDYPGLLQVPLIGKHCHEAGSHIQCF